MFDRPTAISTNEGGLLAGANCESAYYSELIGTWACFPGNDPAWGDNEAVISSHLRRRAVDYAGDNAGRVPAVVGVRVLRVWDLWDPLDADDFEAGIGDRHIRAQQAAMLSLYAIVPFAIAGAVVLRRRGQPLECCSRRSCSSRSSPRPATGRPASASRPISRWSCSRRSPSRPW